jgi:ABC-2 type transport system permease protein
MTTTPTSSGNRFAAGTFTPRPRAASIHKMLAAQSRIELLLLVRNGEQQLLTMFIPITMLIGLCLLPVGDFDESRPDMFVPAVMTVAVMSTAFTGQAIAVGFDRRYGALKRLGATPLPRWGVIAGKSIAVAIVVSIQAVILGALGLILGWDPSPAGLLLGILVIAIGTLVFSAMGLLLGGTLKAEVVLALANLLWFAFIGIASIVVVGDNIPPAVEWIVRCTPSGALSEALHQATAGSLDLIGIAVLAAWGIAAGVAAVRYFKFT